jgi:hypothetical protein
MNDHEGKKETVTGQALQDSEVRYAACLKRLRTGYLSSMPGPEQLRSFKSGELHFLDLPQVAEKNTPRLLDAAGECLL